MKLSSIFSSDHWIMFKKPNNIVPVITGIIVKNMFKKPNSIVPVITGQVGKCLRNPKAYYPVITGIIAQKCL